LGLRERTAILRAVVMGRGLKKRGICAPFASVTTLFFAPRLTARGEGKGPSGIDPNAPPKGPPPKQNGKLHAGPAHQGQLDREGPRAQAAGGLDEHAIAVDAAGIAHPLIAQHRCFDGPTSLRLR